jgi:hypothetical protein
VITCKIRSKPTLTSAIEWKVQPKLGDEFTIPKQNNYGYVIDVISEVCMLDNYHLTGQKSFKN